MSEVSLGSINAESSKKPGQSSGRTWGVGRPKIEFKDGVYEGEAKGYHGMTRVRVTVEDQKMVSVEILSYEDFNEYFEPAEKRVIPQLLKEQNFSVVPSAGATFSSNSIVNAVKDALHI